MSDREHESPGTSPSACLSEIDNDSSHDQYRQISGELFNECAELAILTALVWFGWKKSWMRWRLRCGRPALDADDSSWWGERAEVGLQQLR